MSVCTKCIYMYMCLYLNNFEGSFPYILKCVYRVLNSTHTHETYLKVGNNSCKNAGTHYLHTQKYTHIYIHI